MLLTPCLIHCLICLVIWGVVTYALFNSMLYLIDTISDTEYATRTKERLQGKKLLLNWKLRHESMRETKRKGGTVLKEKGGLC